MQTLAIKEFMGLDANKFADVIPAIRVNSNGYPFLTFTTADNKATNVYFSKSMQVTAGPIDIAFLRGLKACETANAEGELRWKLTNTAGNRVSLADL
jgi:hypothetical protein